MALQIRTLPDVPPPSPATWIWHIFLAHASADLSLARHLFDNLRPHARVFLDAISLGSRPWDRDLYVARTRSLATVALISKNTTNAFWQLEEIVAAAQKRDWSPSYSMFAVYLEDVDAPVGLANAPMIRLGAGGMEQVANTLLNHIRTAVEGTFPSRPRTFVGREKESSILQSFLKSDDLSYAFVSGPAGVGKTLLLNSVLSHPEIKRLYPGGVFQIAPKDIARRQEQENQLLRPGIADLSASELMGRLSEGPQTLVVLDNFDSPSDVRPFIGDWSGVKVAILSENQSLQDEVELHSSEACKIEVNPFTNDEARYFYRANALSPSSEQEEAFIEHAEKLNRLPLALRWAVNLQRLSNTRELRLPTDAEHEYWADIFDECVKYLQKEQAVITRAVLLFANEDIPVSRLAFVAGVDEQTIISTIPRLCDLGLIDYHPLKHTISINPVVHRAAAKRFAKTSKYEVFRIRYVSDLGRCILYPPDNPHLGPHMQRAVAMMTKDDFSRLAAEFDALLPSHDFERLSALIPTALQVDLWRGVLDGHAPHAPAENKGFFKFQLARALLRSGRINDAGPELKEAIEALADPPHGFLKIKAQVMSLYAELLRAEGRLSEAVDTLIEALAICNGINAEPRLLGSIHRKLSLAYFASGELKKAEASIRLSLTEHSKIQSQSNLAYDHCRLGVIYTENGELHKAKREIEIAVSFHEKSMGPDNTYLAYDLNRLGEVLRRLGEYENAREVLERAYQIHVHVHGQYSSQAAIDGLRLAEAMLCLGRVNDAEMLVRKSLLVYGSMFGLESSHFAYGLHVLAKTEQAKREVKVAVAHLQNAARILERRQDHRHRLAEIRTLLGTLLLDDGDLVDAEQQLWLAREYYVETGRTQDCLRVEAIVWKSIVRRTAGPWARSALAYKAFLRSHPDTINVLLAREIAHRIHQLTGGQVGSAAFVLDFGCGTGLLFRELNGFGSTASVIGVDTCEMINIAQGELCGLPPESQKRARFVDAAGDWTGAVRALLGERVTPCAVVLSMTLFQLDPLARLVLFRYLTALCGDGTSLFLSFSAADILLSEAVAPGANATNPFKKRVYDVADRAGEVIGAAYEDAVMPTYPKESLSSLGHFCELYGFVIAPERTQVIKSIRSAKERCEFSRLPVISEKVFGRSLSPLFWSRVEEMLGDAYNDETWGVVIEATLQRPQSPQPVFFWGGVQLSDLRAPLVYAAAAAIRDSDGRTLFVRRGQGAKDLRGLWSLPSATARDGVTIGESLRASVGEHLGIRLGDLTMASVRIAPRNEPTSRVIVMCLYEAESSESVVIKTDKYDAFEWRTEDRTPRCERESDGDCTKSFAALTRLRATREQSRV